MVLDLDKLISQIGITLRQWMNDCGAFVLYCHRIRVFPENASRGETDTLSGGLAWALVTNNGERA